MLLALALYASTAHAGIPAGFGGTPGVVNENTPRGSEGSDGPRRESPVLRQNSIRRPSG